MATTVVHGADDPILANGQTLGGDWMIAKDGSFNVAGGIFAPIRFIDKGDAIFNTVVDGGGNMTVGKNASMTAAKPVEAGEHITLRSGATLRFNEGWTDHAEIDVGKHVSAIANLGNIAPVDWSVTNKLLSFYGVGGNLVATAQLGANTPMPTVSVSERFGVILDFNKAPMALNLGGTSLPITDAHPLPHV